MSICSYFCSIFKKFFLVDHHNPQLCRFLILRRRGTGIIVDQIIRLEDTASGHPAAPASQSSSLPVRFGLQMYNASCYHKVPALKYLCFLFPVSCTQVPRAPADDRVSSDSLLSEILCESPRDHGTHSSISCSSSSVALRIFSRLFLKASAYHLLRLPHRCWGMPSAYRGRGSVVSLVLSMLCIRFSYDFSPNPSMVVISSPISADLKDIPQNLSKTSGYPLFRVASDNPSIFIASRLTNNVNALIAFAGHSELVHISTSTSLSCCTCVSPPHAGHFPAYPLNPLLVSIFRNLRNDHICLIDGDLISFPSSRAFSMLRLWYACTADRRSFKFHRFKYSDWIDQGLSATDSTRSLRCACLSSHPPILNAQEFLGNFAVLPQRFSICNIIIDSDQSV